ncbi:MAG TPA: ATP-binding cassette domain-containing protein [Sedimentisphaerales bacterium]|nr:ATP-binding cassette domain-containing protein [Sedimentisphaerales bacterium]
MKIETHHQWQGGITPRVRQVMRMFGVDRARLARPVEHSIDINLEKGDICYITGPSGAGKTLLLRKLYEQTAAPKVWLENVPLSRERAVIDCIEGTLIESLRALSRAGLSDVFCVLNQPANLSDGQKWRYRLARAMTAGAGCIFVDEFCSALDRVTAAAIAWNIRKWTAKTNVTAILASCHDDILGDLQPDVLIVKHLSGPADIIYRSDT